MSSSSPLLPRGVRRGIDAMRANVERNWNAVDLAAVAGVSSRTLQRQFRSFLGKVPRAVLRDVRLECARRELLQGPPDTKVMDVALRCGFPHFGRFSSEYRRRYSETPSQTLKRQAVFIDGLASMPSLLASGRDRPTVAVCPFEADPENRALARSIADELATALTRSGASVASEARSARYHLTGIMRGPAGQARLTLRLMRPKPAVIFGHIAPTAHSAMATLRPRSISP
jgi:AraC-like DNA-binding protein